MLQFSLYIPYIFFHTVIQMLNDFVVELFQFHKKTITAGKRSWNRFIRGRPDVVTRRETLKSSVQHGSTNYWKHSITKTQFFYNRFKKLVHKKKETVHKNFIIPKLHW